MERGHGHGHGHGHGDDGHGHGHGHAGAGNEHATPSASARDDDAHGHGHGHADSNSLPPPRSPAHATRPTSTSLPPGAAPTKTVLLVKGICCPSEVPIIEGALGALEGVSEVAVNVPQKTTIVQHDAARVAPTSHSRTVASPEPARERQERSERASERARARDTRRGKKARARSRRARAETPRAPLARRSSVGCHAQQKTSAWWPVSTVT